MLLSILAMINVLKGHHSSKLSESSWCIIWFSLMTGGGMNFKPREGKFICSAVNCVTERFLMFCLRNSIVSLDFFCFKLCFHTLGL